MLPIVILRDIRKRFDTISVLYIADRIFMPDRLAALFEHFSLKAHAFQSGPLCGLNTIEKRGDLGQLHLIKEGNVEVWHGKKLAYKIDEPSLLLYPKPLTRSFVSAPNTGAHFICADVSFEGREANPIVNALPDSLCLPLSDLPHCQQVLNLLLEESAECYCGRQVLLDRLFEVLLVQLLRELMEAGSIKVGMLAGLSDRRLRKALVSIHDNPEKEWTVDNLAAKCGMSRSVFSNLFRTTIGETPVRYLQRWRIGLVQKWLKEGQTLSLISEEAGYQSESALSRAFKTQIGLSPRQWLLNEKAKGDG